MKLGKRKRKKSWLKPAPLAYALGILAGWMLRDLQVTSKPTVSLVVLRKTPEDESGG